QTSLKVFPNPVQDDLNIVSDEKILSVTVYSAAGQLVLTQPVNDTKTVIHMSSAVSGMYLVKIKLAGNTEKTVKVIKR
ncbi:T9SS type A sorting domain-containing protein, partial [uncultured Chryseobacterium sp.]|uniref:T9SS type A sorting domain-containing protein n=1 Tax=uncultured Chryseobacterium sp. TaxID=259322 RepID=UPI0025D463CF